MNKYNLHRNEIRNGDIVLFRGTKFISKQIQLLDNAYYNHTGLVFETNSRLMILDSNANGVHPDFLSVRMDENEDFCIIRPNKDVWDPTVISRAVNSAFEKADEHIKYDTELLVEIALYRKTGIKIGLNHADKDICSEFVRRYLRFLSPPPTCYEQPALPYDFITPWDLVIYMDPSKFTILFDDKCDHSKYRNK